jgi:hypothetical protein
MNNFSDYVNEFPIFSHLISKARKLIKTKESLSYVDSDLKKLLKSGELTNLIKKCVYDICTAPCMDPLFLQQDQILLCNDFGGLVVAIGQTKAGEATDRLYSSPGEALIGAISPGGFQYQFQDIGENWNHELFSPDLTLGDLRTYHCSTGDTLLVPISKIFDYRSNGAVIIKIAAPAEVGLTWEFNRRTGLAEDVHASTMEATTLSYIIKFLSTHGNESSIHAIKNLVNHRFHYIRWDAVKAIGKVDPENLHKILKEMTADPHPHVSNASIKMLSQLGVH